MCGMKNSGEKCAMTAGHDGCRVLIGTYRPENAAWIREKRLYNLPLAATSSMGSDPIDEKVLITRAAEAYGRFKSVVLFAGDAPAMAFAASFREVVDGAWLKANGYAVAKTPHGARYALFALGEKLSAAKVLSDPTAEVWVSSSRWTGKIDAEFYSKPLPACGGKSIPNIFEKLRPYFRKWKSAQAFNPVQMEFFDVVSNTQTKETFPFPAPTKGKFTFIDLFAGIGGFRLAMQSNGGKCVFSSEWNESAQKTYYANYGDRPYGDITPQATKDLIPRDFDVLCAGFPCQPFSIAGVSKKKSLGRATGFEDKTQGTLFFDVCTILKQRRPKAFLLENVKNLCSHDKGNTFRVICEALDELDYSVFYKVIDGQNFVPQHRERILIVGFDRKRYGADVDFEFAIKPVTPKPLMRDILEKSPDPRYTLSDKLWGYLQRYAEKHKAAGNGFGFGLAPQNGVSRTLSARYYKDGSEILIEQKGKNPRRLTPLECARLMGYPSNFKIVVSDCQAYRQFGNSVVMPLMADVGRLIVEKLERLERKAMEIKR